MRPVALPFDGHAAHALTAVNSGDSPQQQSQFRRFLLSCRASPRMRTRMPSQQQRVGLEYVMHRVGDKDPEGEDEDGVRIEVPA